MNILKLSLSLVFVGWVGHALASEPEQYTDLATPNHAGGSADISGTFCKECPTSVTNQDNSEAALSRRTNETDEQYVTSILAGTSTGRTTPRPGSSSENK